MQYIETKTMTTNIINVKFIHIYRKPIDNRHINNKIEIINLIKNFHLNIPIYIIYIYIIHVIGLGGLINSKLVKLDCYKLEPNRVKMKLVNKSQT